MSFEDNSSSQTVPAFGTCEELSAFFDDILRGRGDDCPVPQINAQTTVEDLSSGDRLQRGILDAAIRQVLFDPPPELVTALETIDDVFHWHTVRREHSSHQAQEPLVRLRPIQQDDIPILYASALDPQWSHKWRFRGATPSMAEFANLLWAGSLCQFVIEDRENERLVGLVSCYNARHEAGISYLAFTRVSSRLAQRSSHMLEGGYRFLEFVFSHWNFRKLYAEIPGYNWGQFESGVARFFELEAILTDFDYYDGRFWDMRIVSISRENWGRQRELGLKLLYPSG